MGRLSYSAITSLDGYVVDRAGGFEWAAPDEEVHAAVNDLQRDIGTYLYGRRMWEVMRVWEQFGDEDDSAAVRDFARLWRRADKVVYSRTLADPAVPRTRVAREFDPAEVRAWKEGGGDVGVAGPTLAAYALAAGLVDDLHVFLTPVVVGGGTHWLPDARIDLDLVDVRRFDAGVVHLHYRPRG